MRFNINVALLATTAVNAVSIQALEASEDDLYEVAELFSDTMLDYGDHNEDGATGVSLDQDEQVLVSIGEARVDEAMTYDDYRSEALASVLEEYGYDDQGASDTNPSYVHARGMVAQKVTDYFKSGSFMNRNEEGIVDFLGGGEEEAEDIWEWLEQNFHDYQSQATKDALHEYFELLHPEIAQIIAWEVPDQLLADVAGEPVENIDDTWRGEAYNHVYNSLEEFDLEDLIENFTELKVEALYDHFVPEED